MCDSALSDGSQFFVPGEVEILAQQNEINSSQSWHAHTYYELTYVKSGYAYYISKQDVSLVLAGDFLIARPGAAHSYAESSDMVTLNLIFSPDALERLSMLFKGPARALNQLALRGRSSRLRLDDDERLNVVRLLESILEEQTERRGGWQEMVSVLLMELLLALGRHDVTAKDESKHLVSPSQVRRVLEYVGAHYRQDITSQDIARHVGVSVEYISRQFKLATGLSPAEYLRAFRMERAMEQIRTTDKPIGEVAAMVGFSDISSFSRQFRHVCGMTPSQARSMQ